MGVWYPSASTVRGVRGDLEERLSTWPQIWPNHVTRVPSTTQVEPFVWSGAIPKPREMIDGRRIQGLRQMTFDITNKEYELTLLIDRKTFEDQQTGTVTRRIAELAEGWGPFKDEIMAAMLEAGGTGTAYDGNTFFHDTRAEGDSGAIDNNLTSDAAAADGVPTSAEFLAAMNTVLTTMGGYADDQGRKGTQAAAMSQIRVLAELAMTRPVREALQSTLISNTDNIYGRGLAVPDFDPYLTAGTTTRTMYVHAVGAESFRGLVYQERTPLEIHVFDDVGELIRNNGLLIALRQRFVFAYGQFRRMVKYVFT